MELINSLLLGTNNGAELISHRDSEWEGESFDVESIEPWKNSLIEMMQAFRLGLDNGSFIGTKYASAVSGIFHVLTDMKPRIYKLTEDAVRKLDAYGAWGWANAKNSPSGSGWAIALDPIALYGAKLASITFHECLHLWDIGRRYHATEYGWDPIYQLPGHEDVIKREKGVTDWWVPYWNIIKR